MELPRTDRLRPRPVWARHLRRSLLNLQDPGPPTERECVDAMKVLKECRGNVSDSLEREAFRIFVEGGE